jgi:polyhydroxybutyrate depolymerase
VPIPLVLNLHGRGRDMFQQEKVSRMQAKADEAGFVVVNPQALGQPPTWWGPIPGEVGQPDMDFFARLLAYLQSQISLDRDRIYATGLSNGATMVNRLACDMSGTFAAIAPVAGGHVAFDQCQTHRPVSVLAFHGTDDNTIPYYGRGNEVPPVHAWVEAWAERNECQPEPVTGQPDPHVTTETWTGCAEGTEVILYTLEGGGHTWPGAPLDLDLASHFVYIDATDLIWQFFAAHPRPSAPEALACGKTVP